MIAPGALEDEDLCLAELRRLNKARKLNEDPRFDPIPEHILPGLARYLARGVVPGSFMEAMLTNDLRGVMQCADDQNMRALPAIWSFLYNSIPSSAWGSPDNMHKWVESKDSEVNV
jgi:hypothetical protein